ncbi:MAG: insulinase family protein [Verrucomicrobia bacterium]|nr:insulinase family protein [Verrucomicrobiota bacterium]
MDIGDTYKGFALRRILPLKELKAELLELEHEPTGASVMHIANDDTENLFCLSFQTLPYNSNGVAHILEHTVLCGSQKFPVKDPFFAMTRRSLHTFMNALTGSDFTCYPAASQVEKDFYNLLEVYLDAVFHPNLRKESFWQEGHRLEFVKDQLEWKGIVYNEMKGALISPETRLWHHVMEALVPDLPYAHVSGGDPKIIPTLTYEELKAFHGKYYHPSRCLFFFYGNLPLKKHLDFLVDNCLKDVAKLPHLPPLPLQNRWGAPRDRKGFYPTTETEDLEKKCYVALAWLTAPIVDQETALALTLIDAILMETDASPLKYPLLQSGLCVTADAFIDTEMSELPYVIVCRGCKESDAKEIEALILKTLKDVVFDKELIEAALHQLEFSRTEIVGDHAPFGLTLFFRSALAKQHNCPPENALLIHQLFDGLKKRLEDPNYLPSIVKKYFLDNPHRLRVEMLPDPELIAKEEATEKLLLSEIDAKLSTEGKQEVLSRTEKLHHYQKEIEGQSLECLPKVTLHDVPVLTRDYELKEHKHVFYNENFTNQIVYADLFFDMSHIPEEDLSFAQFFISILPELGAGARSYIDNLSYIQAHTGGIGSSFAPYVLSQDSKALRPAIAIRGKALYRKSKELFSLLKEMAESPRLDEEERVEELLMQTQSSLQTRLARSALRYATQLALSGTSIATRLSHQWYGLAFYQMINDLAAEKNIKKICQRLQTLKESILTLRSPHLVLSCDSSMLSHLKKKKFHGLLELPTHSVPTWTGSYPLIPVSSQARPVATPIASTCMAFKVSPYIHPHAPYLSLASHLFDNKVLHPKIREQGGAYQSGTSYLAGTGQFTFYSGRDPQIAHTLKVFEEAIAYVAEGKFTDRDLEEAKLGMIQQLDSPIPPGGRAIAAYTWWREGKTPQMRSHFRKALLEATRAEIQRTIEKELLPQVKEGVVVTMANEELLKKENDAMAHFRKPLPIIPL